MDFNSLQERKTGRTRPIQGVPRVELECSKADSTPVNTEFAMSEEYLLELVIRANFWANPVQYATARREAEMVLSGFLYEDTLQKVDEVNHLINLNEFREAKRILREIRENLLRNHS